MTAPLREEAPDDGVGLGRQQRSGLPEGVAIRPATVADLPAVADILEDARAWLAATSIPQWTLPFDEAWLRPRIAAGEVWLLEDDRVAVATVRLLRADAAAWGARDTGDAAYVHTLAVRRDRAGQGLGAWILGWAAERALAEGARVLRLDCIAGNDALCRYYERAGFARVGTTRLGGDDLVLFERNLVRSPPVRSTLSGRGGVGQTPRER